MVKLISPLEIYLKEILPYLKECIQKQCGTSNVEVIVLTKVGDQVQMQDTFPAGKVDYQIMMMEGIVEALKGGKGQ